MKKLSELVDSPVVLVTNHDDWEGLFINGVADHQAHKVQRDDLVKACLKAGQNYCTVYASYDELEISGQFPDNLDDLPEYIEIELAKDK